jgi:hypothetical protein
MITYSNETWVLKESVKRKFLVTRRKMLRRIFGPKKDRDCTVRGELKQVMNRQLGFEP